MPLDLLGFLKVGIRELGLTLRGLKAKLVVQGLLEHEFAMLFREFEEMLLSLILLDSRLLHNYIP